MYAVTSGEWYTSEMEGGWYGFAFHALSMAARQSNKHHIELMSKTNLSVLAWSVGLLLSMSTSQMLAQNTQGGQRPQQRNGQGGRGQRQGNFDPAQFQQRMLDRYKERLEITDDTEWKAIQPLIQKVMDARTELGAGTRGMFGRGGRPGGAANQGDQGQGQRRTVRPPSAAAEQLQKAIDEKAPATEIKAALARYAEYRKEKQADLEKAQASLRSVLSARQEAIATLSGLL